MDSDTKEPDIDRHYNEEFGKTSSSNNQDKTASSDDLKSAEEDANISEDRDSGASTNLQSAEAQPPINDGLFSAHKDTSGSMIQRGKGRLKGLMKHKGLLIGAGLGGGSLALILFALFFLAGLLKIPDLAQHITEYEFANLTRQFSQSAERTTEEALAVEATDDATHSALKDAYANLRGNTWGKLDNFRPSQVAKTLGKKNGLKLNTHVTITGRTVLDSVDMNGTPYEVKQTGGIKKFIPGIRQLDQFKNNVEFSRNFAPDLIDSMAANDVGPIIRAATAKNIRQKLGIGLVAWTVGRYAGKTPAEAELQANRDALKAIDEPGVTPTTVGELNDAEQKAKDTISTDVQDDTKLKDIIAHNGEDFAATTAIDKEVGSNALTTLTGLLDPAYRIALPACIIYEGSLDKAGPSINAQTAEQQRAYYYIATAADQERDGTDASPEAIGAINTKLGDTTQSNAGIRASGGTVDTSATSLSAEASPLGDYTLFDAIPGFGNSATGALAKSFANKMCPALSNLWIGIGTGILIQVGTGIADIFTLGGATAAEESAGALASGVADVTAETITQRLVTALSEKFASTFSKEGATKIAAKVRSTIGIKNLTKETAKVTGLVGLTVLAKLIVMANAHQTYNGLEQGPDFANEADSGGNIQANEISRAQTFARPLTSSEVSQSDQSAAEYVSAQNKTRSFTDRYFALSNADSLVSHMAMSLSGTVKPTLLSSIVNLGSVILRPLSYLGSLLNMSGIAHAAPDPSTQHYGNVQFGWSQAEEDLINSDNSYLPLENIKALQDGLALKGMTEGDIASTYAKCFGYSYNKDGDGSFDPSDPNSSLQLDITGDGSLGTLLSSGHDILRDSDGNVKPDQGDCSPQNLGPNNPTYGNLVFRWRLAVSYNLTLDQLTSEQSITGS